MRALYSGDGGGWKNDLTNSLALSAGKKLTITPSVTGNRRQFTIMCNVRRVRLGAAQYILNASNQSQWYFDSSDRLVYNGTASGGNFVSTKKFRDSEWFFIGIAFDSVSRTIKMVHNDQEIDQWDGNAVPNENWLSHLNWAGQSISIGAYNGGVGTLEANISDFVILDGEVLTPQEMIDYRTQNVPHGNNVITTTKKFTTEGTQERFIGLHRNDPASSSVIKDEGPHVERAAASWDSIHSDILPKTGKFLVELITTDAEDAQAGVAPASNHSQGVGQYIGLPWAGSAGIYFARLSGMISYIGGVTQNPTVGAPTTPKVGGVSSYYIDMDAKKLYFAYDGVFITGQDPVAGTGGYGFSGEEDFRFYISLYNMQGVLINFGQTDYTHSVPGYGPLKEPAKSDLKRCKLNPGDNSPALKDGQLTSTNTANNWGVAYSNFVIKDKAYAELRLNNSLMNTDLGVVLDSEKLSSIATIGSSNKLAYANGSTTMQTLTNGTQVATGPTISATSVFGVAVDTTTNEIWLSVDGTWVGSDPSGAAWNVLPAGDVRFFSAAYGNSIGGKWNFGDSPWKYTAPIGFVGPASLDFDTLKTSGDLNDVEYGPNGCQLIFEDSSNLGLVTAGNKVHWSLTGITSDDQLVDTPSDPYPVWNPLDIDQTSSIPTFSDGGRLATLGSYGTIFWTYARSSMYQNSGQIYVEMDVITNGGTTYIGVHENNKPETSNGFGTPIGAYLWHDVGDYWIGGALASGKPTFNLENLKIAINFDVGKGWFGVVGGAWNEGDPALETAPSFTFTPNTPLAFMCGRSSFSGESSIKLLRNSGEWIDTPPTGFKELKSSNRPTPKYHGRDKFDINLSIGTSSARDIPTAFEKTGLFWGKARSSAYSHRLEDRLRGAGKGLFSDTTSTEGVRMDSIVSFGDDVISLGADAGSGYNENGVNYGYWMFGNDGTETTNNDGTVPSQVIVDSSGYMSIARATTLAAGDTFGIGLQDHELTILKDLGQAGSSWPVWCQYMSDRSGSTQRYMALDASTGQSALGDTFRSMASGLVTSGSGSWTIGDVITYNFKSVPGLCHVFGYEGNADVNNGPFIPLNFKARWLLIKGLNGSSWYIVDTERSPMNERNGYLNADTSATESILTYGIDITSQGIKIRQPTGWGLNNSGVAYIGLAIADVAGGGNLPAVLGN
ncbi:DUF7483 domain-containing protein [Kiloniella antarctica]|uniref:DUF7483 domain-containing protein n=1 Tax=Kiloniella antarctica TaxID=1550907 RepID=A0ABW5BKV0_9PROT